MNNVSLIPNVNWQKYFCANNFQLNRYLEDCGDEFLLNVFNVIKDAMESEKSVTVLISFIESQIVALVEQHEYQLVLQKLLNVCEHLEKYEICQLIVDFEKKLENTHATKSHINVPVENYV